MAVHSRVLSRADRVRIQDRRITSLIRYIVLIPLLAPRGLEEYVPGYKTFMTLWAMLSLGLIILDGVLRMRSDAKVLPCPIGLVAYFFVAIIDSALSSDGIVNGLQVLFYYPAAFLYILNLEADELKEYAVASAWILLIIFAIQLVAGQLFFSSARHMTFLGHIQVFSQYGMLAAFLGILLIVKKWASLVLAVALLATGAICMLTVEADSAHYGILLIVVMLALLKIFPSLSKADLRIVTLLGIGANILVVWLTLTRQSPLIGTELDWTFNGRLFVWESASEQFWNSPWIGYGIENSHISTFWSEQMTYAHNQVMQSLVDGGVLLTSMLVWMLCTVARCINRIADRSLKNASIAVYFALLFVMIFDGFTLYGYIFVLFAFIAYMGISSSKEVE